MIRISLFGAFAIHGPESRVIGIDSRKGRALLAYLASHPGCQSPREQVCALFWGTRSEEQARGSLRQLLTILRGQLHEAGRPLVTGRETIGLDPAAVATDTAEFERSLRNGTAEAATAALRLYRGPFLQNLDLAEAGYEDWVEAERRRFHAAACRAAETLLDHGERTGDRLALRHGAGRLLELEPGHEKGHRALMRLHALEGDASAALRQYRLCRQILDRDLGAAPSPETDELASEIRHGRLRTPVVLTDADAAADATPAATPGPSLNILPLEAHDEFPAARDFADGLTRDIATELSRFRSFAIRIGGEAAADFILSGRIRRFPDRIRISALLADGRTGAQLWADHYDRPPDALFTVLDEMVTTVAGTVVGRLEAACAQSARRKPPSSLAAYECVLRGDALPIGDPAAEAEASALYERAIKLDPGYGRARAMLAYQLSLEWFGDLGGSDVLLDRALELARSAVALDPCDSVGHNILGWVHLLRKSFDLAEHHKRRARELVPSSVYEHACMGVLKVFLGDPDAALACFERARALDPFYEPAWFWRMQGIAHFETRHYDDAVSCFQRSPTMPLWVHAYLAACHALASRSDAAALHAAVVLKRAPGFTADRFSEKEPFRREDDRQHLHTGLIAAGLPSASHRAPSAE